jgi:hypothetical protein
MNAIFLSKRNFGILLFAVGIFLSTGLTLVLTWAGYEAESYGFERMMGGEHLDGLICPAFMTYHETGTIRVQVDNSSTTVIEPMLRIDTSTRGMPDSAQMQLKVEPGETRQFEQPVTSDNIDLVFLSLPKPIAFRRLTPCQPQKPPVAFLCWMCLFWMEGKFSIFGWRLA